MIARNLRAGRLAFQLKVELLAHGLQAPLFEQGRPLGEAFELLPLVGSQQGIGRIPQVQLDLEFLEEIVSGALDEPGLDYVQVILREPAR